MPTIEELTQRLYDLSGFPEQFIHDINFINTTETHYVLTYVAFGDVHTMYIDKHDFDYKEVASC